MEIEASRRDGAIIGSTREIASPPYERGNMLTSFRRRLA